MAMKKPLHGPNSIWSWVVVAAASFSTLLVFGMAKSAGLLYKELPLIYNIDRSTAASITTIKTSIMSIVGPISGLLVNYVSCRQMTFAAGICTCLGLIVCSLAPSMVVFMVGYGLLYGMGAGLSVIPSRIVVTNYFVEKSIMALGLSMTGSCIGGMVIPPMFEMFIEMYGLQRAMLVMSGILLHNCVCAMIYFPLPEKKTDPKPVKTVSEDVDETVATINGNQTNAKDSSSASNGHVVIHCNSNEKNTSGGGCKSFWKDLSVLLNPRFFLIALTSWGGHASVTILNLCLPDYAMTESTDEISRSQAASMISCVAAGDLVGRLFVTWLSSRNWFPLKYSFSCTLFIISVLFAALPFVRSYNGLMVFSVILGLAIGAILLVPTFLFNYYLPPTQWAAAYGFSSMLLVIPSWIGPIIGNLRETSGSYSSSFFMISGISMCCAISWLIEGLITRKKKHGSYTVTKGFADHKSLQHAYAIRPSLSFS